MRWNARRWTSRPPSSNKGARAAWDYFVDAEAEPVRHRYAFGNMGSAGPARKLADLPPQRREPEEMTFRFLSHWVWVMKFKNGEYEEIDVIELRIPVRQPEAI